MRKTIHLASAVFLAGLNGFAQQPTAAYSFQAVVQPGMKIDNQEFTDYMAIDDAVLNDNGEYAFIARWTDSQDDFSVICALYGVVVRSYDEIDGNLLMRIGRQIAINNNEQIAYTADFRNRAGEDFHGIFLGRTLLYFVGLHERVPAGNFYLTQDGKVIPPPGFHAWIAPGEKNKAESAPKNTSNPSRFGIKLPPGIAKRIPVKVPLKPEKNQTSKETSMDRRLAAPPAVTDPIPTGPCPVPDFPTPQEWRFGAAMEGPITSHIFDGVVANRNYISSVSGPLPAPIRIIHVNRFCSPLLIAITDLNLKGRFELWSPMGLITFEQPDGTYSLPGFDGSVKALMRANEAPPVNKRGQILLSFTLSRGGQALLLGTPLSR
jgi:hypothetical protein